MKDAWQSGSAYERYMGRWSRRVAEAFVDWLSPKSGLRWLDVGCGSGALSEAAIERHEPASVTAVDQSEGFVRTASRRLGVRAICTVGDALSLPLDDASCDIAVSGLVLNFIGEPARVLSEMRRVTGRDGTVAVYIWDYAGKMDLLTTFWDAVVGLDPDASGLHEGRRFRDANAAALSQTFRQAGLCAIETTPIEIATDFVDFDDYWTPLLGGQGPAPTYVSSLEAADRDRLRELLRRSLPVQQDGSISLTARAWAIKGVA